MAVWLPLAEAGDRDAQYRYGGIFRDGKGLPQDNAIAIEWLVRAALQGQVEAQNELGFMFSQGDGLPLKRDKAKCWFVLAAEQGEVQAQFNLSNFLERGEGPGDVVYWTERAARPGHVRAMSILGWVRWRNPLKRNKTEAYMYLLLAAERGDSKAIEYLAEIRQSKWPPVKQELAAAETRAAAWRPVLEEPPTMPLTVPDDCLP